MSLTSYRAAPSRDTVFGLPRGAHLEPMISFRFGLRSVALQDVLIVLKVFFYHRREIRFEVV